MKGKISTKAIIITILTVVLLAIATTGTVLFLKDSGEAAAMEEQNTVGTLPVAGSDNQIEANTEQTVENEGENPEIVRETEQVETEQQTGETEQNENQAQGTETQTINTSPTQNTGVITEEPEPTTVEQERVISEETTLGWNNLSVSAGQANYTEREINYNNLKYTVNYYEDGELVHTEIIKGNSLGKEITEVEDRMKAEYYLDEENTTKLPITITENEKDNVIDIHYLIKKYNIAFTAGENGSLEGITEFIVPSGSEFGSKVTVPETKGNTGYCFDKWEPEIPAKDSKVTADATYKAIFAKDENGNDIPDYRDTYHKVTFTADENGSLNGTTEFSVLTGLTFGSKVTVPKTTANKGYCFDKWDPEIPAKDSKVTADATYKATFVKDTYGYRVDYYYEGINGEFALLTSETEYGTAKYQDTITSYKSKTLEDNYVFDHVTPVDSNGNVSLIISENAEENVISVYYKRNSFDYKIEYYKDSINGEKLGEKETRKQKLKTTITEEIVRADYNDDNWKNAFKPSIGYKDGEVQEWITIEANNNNIIKVIYKPQTDISYTVKYFFNGTEDKDKKYSGTGTFGTEITAKDYSDSEWELATNSTLVFTIAATENIFEVNYVKPEITVEKSADKQGNVQPGEKITYTIKATNTGLKDGTVKISDTIPEGTILDPEGRITATGINKEITQEQLKAGIELPVSKEGEAIITFTVKVTANVNTTISNQATVLEGGTNSKTNIVENKVEKKVNVNAKSEKVTITNSNIVVILDNSGSMDTKTNEIVWDGECKHGDWQIISCPGYKYNNGIKYHYHYETRMEVAKDVTKDLVDMVKLPETATNDSSIISVIKFSTNASIVGSAETASQVGNLKNNIDTIKASGNTEMAKALKKAKEELARMSEDRKNNKNIVIFVSDGEPTDRTSRIATAASDLKKVATVYAVAFDSDITILKNIIATSGKYYTTSQVASLKDIFSDVAQDISNSKKSIESTNGRIELENIDMDKEIIIKVNGKKLTDITEMIDTEKGENGENDKYYLDLTQFNPSDKIEIEYFSTK